MPATLIDGKPISLAIKEEAKKEGEDLLKSERHQARPRVYPGR